MFKYFGDVQSNLADGKDFDYLKSGVSAWRTDDFENSFLIVLGEKGKKLKFYYVIGNSIIITNYPYIRTPS